MKKIEQLKKQIRKLQSDANKHLEFYEKSVDKSTSLALKITKIEKAEKYASLKKLVGNCYCHNEKRTREAIYRIDSVDNNGIIKGAVIEQHRGSKDSLAVKVNTPIYDAHLGKKIPLSYFNSQFREVLEILSKKNKIK